MRSSELGEVKVYHLRIAEFLQATIEDVYHCAQKPTVVNLN